MVFDTIHVLVALLTARHGTRKGFLVSWRTIATATGMPAKETHISKVKYEFAIDLGSQLTCCHNAL